MSKIIENIYADYKQSVEFNIKDENIKWEDVKEYSVKWDTLYLCMKDGTTKEFDSSRDCEIDWKWPDETTAYDTEGGKLNEQ